MLGHADGSLTLWEACAPPPADSAVTPPVSVTSASSDTTTAAAATPMLYWGALPVHTWTAAQIKLHDTLFSNGNDSHGNVATDSEGVHVSSLDAAVAATGKRV